MSIESRSPTTGEVLERFDEVPADEIEVALSRTAAVFPAWRARPFAARGDVLRKTASLLRDRKERYGRTMALEMGKPVTQGEGEAEKCAWVCEYYAENAERFLAEEPRESDASRSLVRYDPIGAVLAIMPWNFPFWQVFRFAAPALMAGNVGILKHASNVPRCALDIEELLLEAGLPEGAFRTLLVGSKRVSDLIADPRIAAVTLTGSEHAGMEVGAAAGRALKKSVLELGGSDPFIVLDDADVADAAKSAASARLINSGQSCIAAKRFLVASSIADEFTEAFRDALAAARVGDPLEPETTVGPQARPDLRDDLHRQVEESRARGARLLLGGEVPDGPGAFYPPSLLADVTPGMPAFDEEVFGPVAAVTRFEGDDDAVALANRSTFGLGTAIWTGDAERAMRLAPFVESGCVFVNGPVKSDPRLPFGGVKRSGYGRELSEVGIREFVNVKTVWVR